MEHPLDPSNKIGTAVPGALVLAILVFSASGSLSGQTPANLVGSEVERSQKCVPELARLIQLEEDLQPFSERSERLQQIDRAIAVEDSARATPFDENDPVEASVQDWFVRDGELAQRYLDAEGDETLQEELREERREARQQIRQEVREGLISMHEEAQARIDAEEDLENILRDCQEAIFVRDAVLEVCDDVTSPVCDAARQEEPGGRFRFVDAPEDLWHMEQMRPWTSPTRLGLAQDGSLGGARTGTLARRGNATLLVGVEAMIEERSELTAEEETEYQEMAETMGLEFDDPRYVMVPGLAIHLDIPGPLDQETHYLLHFGDLSDPQDQVVATIPANEDGGVDTVLPAPEWALVRMAEGEPLSLTAIAYDEETGSGRPLFEMGLTEVGQSSALLDLLAYMASGDLAQDLRTLRPLEEDGR